jgi:hypothetical protein
MSDQKHSRLMEMLVRTVSRETGRQRPALLDELCAARLEAREGPAREIIYDFEMVMGAKYSVRPNAEDIEHENARRMICRVIAEAVFGEFRNDLELARLAILNHQPKKAARHIDDVIDRMFRVP